MTNIFNKGLIIFFSAVTTYDVFANLPENISDLVDSSAPAVVNITAKKEVSQRSSFGYGGIPDEMLERFGIPREFREREMPQQKREATSYDLALS
jgi:serine protease Do